MPLPRPSSPKVLLSDIRGLMAERSRHQLVAATLAICMPILIVAAFVIDVKTNTAPGPQLIYIKSWSANRTDAEIIADQKKAQIEKDAAKKEHQRQVRKLADQLGIE